MIDHTRRRMGDLWILLPVLLLAFGLRLFRLGAESLWYDETVSVYLAGQNLPDLVAHTARDIHPPGYYLLLHGWIGVAGSSDWAVAIPSVFFGLLLVVLAYRLAARLLEPRVGLLAALLVAVSPYNLWYSQEVRMYTVGAVLSMALLVSVLLLLPVGASWWSLTRKGDKAHKPWRGSWQMAVIYAVLGALGLWVLYYFAFLLIAINLMVGLWWLFEWRKGRARWPWLGRWLLAQLGVMLLYAPWLPVAWRQATNPPVPPWRSFTGLGDLLLQTWSALSLGQSVDVTKLWPALLLFGVLFGLGLVYLAERPSGEKEGRLSPVAPGNAGIPLCFFAGYVFLPVLLIYLASFITPLYHVRYTFTYSTPFYIVLGAGLVWLWRRRRAALGLGLVSVLILNGISILAYHTDVHYAADDHRAAVRFLADRWRPGDAILVDAGYVYTALLTYWDSDPIAWRGRLADYEGQSPDSGPVMAEAGTVDGSPSLGWGDPASDFYAMSRSETVTALDRLFASADRVWVYRIYDTVTDPDGFIRDWLEQHGTRFEDQVFTGESQLRVQGFLTDREPFAEGTQQFDTTLADGSLTLLGSRLESRAVAVGDALDLALVWHVEAPMMDGAILFAGLFDDSGQRWAQVDERPLGSLYPVSSWPRGATVRTPLRLTIPPGTPPGKLKLEVGWYRFVDGQPIWVPWPQGVWQSLGTIDVVAPPDWKALPFPEMDYPAGVTLGSGVRFLGFSMPTFEASPGDFLPVDLFWQADASNPGIGLGVLQLADDEGTVWAEIAQTAGGGRVRFAEMEAGQVVLDPRHLQLPTSLKPGVYNLLLGRRLPNGAWLPVRRGLVSLGGTYPLATIRIRQ